MPTGPKIRSDSRLKTLPESVQADIVQKLRLLSREKVKAWLLKEHKVQTNVASLSEFLQWWQGQKRLEEAASLARQISKVLAENPAIKLDSDQVAQAGQTIFEAMAVANQDADLYVDLANVRQNAMRTKIAAERNQLTQSALALERQKFEFQAVKAMLAHVEVLREIKGRTDLSEDEQIRLAREKVFGELPKTKEAA